MYYFYQLLWLSSPKYKLQNTFNKVIEIQNTFKSHCLSITQWIFV